MIILTGANMSGKSTYLKQNAIICLLSQIGSFVPASEANLTLIDKIFIRQGSTDDIINNNSSFMVEMIDLNFILNMEPWAALNQHKLLWQNLIMNNKAIMSYF